MTSSTTPGPTPGPGPGPAVPPPDALKPRRTALLRATAVGGAVVPLCLAGWLGWQAVSAPDRGHPDSASAPVTVAATSAATAATSPTGTDLTGTAPAAPPATTDPAVAPSTAPAPSQPPVRSPSQSPSQSPTQAATPAPTRPPGAGASLAGRTVLLDPGHNPNNFAHTTEISRLVDIGNTRKECDATGTSTNAGYTEAAYSLDVVRRTRALLTAQGATVVLTQDGDRPWGPCIDERARAGAGAHADVAVSVHGDGGPATGSGFHVIMPAKVVVPGKTDNSAIVAPSQRLGLLLRDSFKAATGEPYADYTARQGLDTRSDLGGLNLSTVPKVFIECGNMRNPADAKRMTDPQWRQLAAQGIADALTSFLVTTGGTTGTGTTGSTGTTGAGATGTAPR